MRVQSARDRGALIRERRKALGWDQQQLAARIGASRLWVSEMENGKPTVQLDLALRALDALGVRLSTIETDEGAGKSHSAAAIADLLRRR